jgi:ParB-like chromosome segregation protein Spo0J
MNVSRIAEPQTTPKIVQVDLVDLVVGDRLRQVDAAHVDVLVKSITEIGLQQPIHVWQDINGRHHLVTGVHRVRAAERLGWTQIPAVVVDHDELDRRRCEIAENLHRAELTALERDEQIAEWIKLTDQKLSAQKRADVSSQVATKPHHGGRPESGVSRSARELNIKKDDAHRAVKVAKLSPKAKKLARQLKLDKNRSALLAASKHREPKKQMQALEAWNLTRKDKAGKDIRYFDNVTDEMLAIAERAIDYCDNGTIDINAVSREQRIEYARRITEALPLIETLRNRLLDGVTNTVNATPEAATKIADATEAVH